MLHGGFPAEHADVFCIHKTVLRERSLPEPLAPGPLRGDEVWQRSKDSADAATAFRAGCAEECAVREKAKSGIDTVTEVLSSLFSLPFIIF